MGQTVSVDYLALYEYTLPKPQLNAEANGSKPKDHLDSTKRDLKILKILRIWPQNIEMNFNDIKCEQFKEHQNEDGSWYYGEMRNNQKQGPGILVYGAQSSITHILGNFNKDQLEGQGLVLYNDETYYFGGWRAGKCDGFGYYMAKNGDFYLGEWKQGQLTQGYYRNSNYEYYGEMRNGNLDGYGRCIYYDGAIVEGQWANDQMQGFITHQFPNGDVYHGDCKFSLKHGMGILDLQKENEIYAGNFCMDKYHGFGQLIKISQINEKKQKVIKNGFFKYGQLAEMYQEFTDQDQDHLNWKLVDQDRQLDLSNKGTFCSELRQQELDFNQIIRKRQETSEKIEKIIMNFNSHKDKYIKYESQLNMVTELVKLQKWYYAVDSKNLPSHFQNEWTNYLDAEPQ